MADKNSPAFAPVRNLYDGFARGDMQGAVSTVAADVEWIEHFPYPGTFIGPEAILEVFAKVGREFESYEMDFERWIDDGDVLIVLGRYTVKKRGVDEPLRSPFAHIFNVAGGKVTRYEGLLDTGQALRLFGELAMEEEGATR